jgi:hypothetical protein
MRNPSIPLFRKFPHGFWQAAELMGAFLPKLLLSSNVIVKTYSFPSSALCDLIYAAA